MNAAAPSHKWAYVRLTSWLAGLLDDDASRRIEAHVERCEPCRAEVQALRDAEFTPDDRGRHLPASILARWDRQENELRGLARGLARRHLERCDVCRSQLKTLGYRPELPWVESLEPPAGAPGLEGKGAVAPMPDQAGDSTDQRPPLRLRPRWRPPRRWLLASPLAAAATLLIVVLLPTTTPVAPPIATGPMPPVESPQIEPPAGEPGPSPVPPAPAPGPPPLLLALGPESPGAYEFPTRTRGTPRPGTAPAGSEIGVRLSAPDGVAAFRVPLALRLLDGDRPVVVEVTSAEGRVMRRFETRLGAMVGNGGRTIVLRQGEPTLTPGSYELRFELHAEGAEPELHRFAFRIE